MRTAAISLLDGAAPILEMKKSPRRRSVRLKKKMGLFHRATAEALGVAMWRSFGPVPELISRPTTDK